MEESPRLTLPRGAGTAIFAGGGAWLPRPNGRGTWPLGAATERAAPVTGTGTSADGRPAPAGGRAAPVTGLRGDEAILLADPLRVLAATEPGQLPGLLAEIETEQLQGRYVAGYLAYEAGEAFGRTVRHGPARPLPAGALACDDVPLAWVAVWQMRIEREACCDAVGALGLVREPCVRVVGGGLRRQGAGRRWERVQRRS